MMFTKKLVRIAAILLAMTLITSTAFAESSSNLWPSAGQNLQNTRSQDNEHTIKVKNVASLAVKWQFTTGGDVSATPALDDNAVYFPDWAGNLFALDKETGTQLWSHKISDYTGIAGDTSRATPAIAGSYLIFGDQGGKVGGGAWVMAVNKQTGSLVWKTLVESSGFKKVTQ
jgi:polyvinyl alcohol dehydrogenase (cytochrome)